MKIGIVILATNKYIKFVQSLCESIRKFFLVDYEIKIFILTDSTQKIQDTIQFTVQHHKWPDSTLLRYHKIRSISSVLLDSTDYVFHCDADMRFVSPVKDDILGDSVATIHPGFWNKLHNLPYEKNPLSKAYVPSWSKYYAGGFNGGKTQTFLEMTEVIATNIDKDKENNIIAIWHDESHLNAYRLHNPPSVELNPSYCYPESWDMPFPKILLALDKNHAEMREIGAYKRKIRL